MISLVLVDAAAFLVVLGNAVGSCRRGYSRMVLADPGHLSSHHPAALVLPRQLRDLDQEGLVVLLLFLLRFHAGRLSTSMSSRKRRIAASSSEIKMAADVDANFFYFRVFTDM